MTAGRHSDDDNRAPRMSDPTAVDEANPFDSTDLRVDDAANGQPARQTQLTSDPPTGLVRREGFRELPPGCVVGENYEIDARIGSGAMGEVYAARHVSLGKRVAVKVIGQRLSEDESAIERFAMEARTLAQIQHPSIVAVEHVGELADGRAYFVMEFLRGESLFARLQRGRLPLPEALRVIDQMARGLDAAHAEGVTHRDVKPENTFLVQLPGEPPAVKIVDFGLMKLAADRAAEDRRAERTQSGVAIGTPMYMSPEQARGPDVDHRTDIYALGCVAYELLLGTPPFPHAKTAPELYAAHLHESPPLPRSLWPDIPPQLDLVLFAMLAKDPAHRPTLAQVRAVIAAVRDGTPSQRASTEFVGPRPGRAQKRLAILAVALLALVGGITIGASTTQHPSSSEPTKPVSSTPKAKISPETPSAPSVTPLPSPRDLPAPSTAVQPTKKDVAPVAKIAAKPERAAGSRSAKIVPKPSPAVVPVDAGIAAVDARVDETISPPVPAPAADKLPPKAGVDRNQTINPFAKKRPKVNP